MRASSGATNGFRSAVAWLVCVIGWPVVSLIPPKYESSARVYISADQYLTPLLKGLATDVDPRRQVEYLQRTLLSRPNLEQVMHLSNLDISPCGKISETEREEKLLQMAKDVTLDLAGAESGEDHLPEFESDGRQGCRAVAADRLRGNHDRRQSP